MTLMPATAENKNRNSDPTVVEVGLGARSYEIAIGRGLLPSLGSRIKVIRPGARVAIVTDRTVAQHWLKATEQALSNAGIESTQIIVGEGEGSKTYGVLEDVSEGLI